MASFVRDGHFAALALIDSFVSVMQLSTLSSVSYLFYTSSSGPGQERGTGSSSLSTTCASSVVRSTFEGSRRGRRGQMSHLALGRFSLRFE